MHENKFIKMVSEHKGYSVAWPGLLFRNGYVTNWYER
jgi:hypothetical protein